jgi:hypothetical protein
MIPGGIAIDVNGQRIGLLMMLNDRYEGSYEKLVTLIDLIDKSPAAPVVKVEVCGDGIMLTIFTERKTNYHFGLTLEETFTILKEVLDESNEVKRKR